MFDQIQRNSSAIAAVDFGKWANDRADAKGKDGSVITRLSAGFVVSQGWII